MGKPEAPWELDMVQARLARGSWINCQLCGSPHGRRWNCQQDRADRLWRLAVILGVYAGALTAIVLARLV